MGKEENYYTRGGGDGKGIKKEMGGNHYTREGEGKKEGGRELAGSHTL